MKERGIELFIIFYLCAFFLEFFPFLILRFFRSPPSGPFGLHHPATEGEAPEEGGTGESPEGSGVSTQVLSAPASPRPTLRPFSGRSGDPESSPSPGHSSPWSRY